MIIVIPLMVGLITAFIVLQIQLCKMDANWPGLILPILTLFMTVQYIWIGFLFPVNIDGDVFSSLLFFLVLFVGLTITFYAIYKKRTKNKEFDKMTINDLG
jgi:predicted RND superfamily exporter protein